MTGTVSILLPEPLETQQSSRCIQPPDRLWNMDPAGLVKEKFMSVLNKSIQKYSSSHIDMASLPNFTSKYMQMKQQCLFPLFIRAFGCWAAVHPNLTKVTEWQESHGHFGPENPSTWKCSREMVDRPEALFATSSLCRIGSSYEQLVNSAEILTSNKGVWKARPTQRGPWMPKGEKSEKPPSPAVSHLWESCGISWEDPKMFDRFYYSKPSSPPKKKLNGELWPCDEQRLQYLHVPPCCKQNLKRLESSQLLWRRFPCPKLLKTWVPSEWNRFPPPKKKNTEEIPWKKNGGNTRLRSEAM